MKTTYSVFFITLILSPFFSFSQNRTLEKLVSYIVHSETEFVEVPGMVVGVIDRDSTYYYYFGEKEKGITGSPNEHDVFEIGSITKVLTASLYSLLEAEGEFSLDDQVNTFYGNKFAYLDSISIDDLLTHSSGLPKLPSNLGINQSKSTDPYSDYGRKELIEYIYGYQSFDRSYNYSHVGYAFLGEILTKKTGRSYPSLLREHLLNPLCMNHTYVGDGPSPTFGYSLSGNLVEPWTFKVFNSSLGARSTASDMVKFLSVLLGDSNPKLGDILYENAKERSTSSIPHVWMGRGWHIFRPKKNFYDVVAHSGVTGGHRVYLGFVRETHTAVVILSNSEMTMNGAGNIILQAINNNWRKKQFSESK